MCRECVNQTRKVEINFSGLHSFNPGSCAEVRINGEAVYLSITGFESGGKYSDYAVKITGIIQDFDNCPEAEVIITIDRLGVFRSVLKS